MQHDPRRASPRIGIEALCWEVIGDYEASSLVVDLSTQGARLERPYLPPGWPEWESASTIELGPAGRGSYSAPRAMKRERGPGTRSVPLQLEVPGLDEVMWARGEVVFDELVAAPKHKGGPFGLLRRTGYHISLAARRDLNLLSDFVWDTYAKRRAADDDYSSTVCMAI
jgi:hypothetical protein